ncbi:MAG: hypothetical protein P8M34_12850 [Saprospiraceae bacterium]|nr:hypothetical protein [Saprospiraceae bacterium]
MKIKKMKGTVLKNNDKSANPKSSIEEDGITHRNKFNIKINKATESTLKGDLKKDDIV